MSTSTENLQTLNKQAVALTQQRRLDEAAQILRQALLHGPDDPETHTNLGNVYVYKSKYDDAIVEYQHALRVNPNIFNAQYILGIALHDKRRFDEAVTHFRHAPRLNPQYAEAHQSLGLTLLEQRKLPEAAACFKEAIRLNPNFAQAHGNLGTVLSWQDQHAAAATCYQHALRLNPNCAETYFNLGKTLEHTRDMGRAEQCYREALRLNPAHAGAWINLGNLLYEQDRKEEAIACFQETIRVKPDYAHAYANLGNAYGYAGRFEEALASYDRGVALEPELVGPHHNRALIWLLLGKWAEAWQEYEWRCQTKEFPKFLFVQPRWDGSPLEGRTLLVHTEQGLGDTLQFVRYLPLIAARGGKVVLNSQPALRRLLSISLKNIQIVAIGDPLPPFDLYIPLLSLPGVFGTTPTNVPADIPYIKADTQLVEHWRNELASVRGIKVGIAWQGNPTYCRDRQRSMPLASFAPFAGVDGVKLISLQKGPGSEQLRSLARRLGMLDLGPKIDDASGPFMDTAAIMRNLDLVISSDTVIPHLAGALGVPVWTALPMTPDWRWLLHRQDTPWYPGMRLFRQTRDGHWDDVFDFMSQELKRLVAKGTN